MSSGEHQELIDLCQRCINEDCNSENGCKTYIALKKRLENGSKSKKAAMEIVKPPEDLTGCTAETLERCNNAITALEALNNDAGCDFLIHSEKIIDVLKSLKAARIQAYESLIDWEAIAERMKEKE